LGVDYRGLPESAAGATQDVDVNFAKAIGPDYWEKRKSVFDFRQDTASLLNQGKMQTYVGAQPVTFKGPAVRVAPRSPAMAIGTLRAKSVADAADFPAVITQQHGAGRVVYFAAGFDAAYYLYAYPYQRLAIQHAALWAARDPQPVTVDAPMCVHAQVMRQSREGERLIVHLFNDVNTTAHHALPNDDVPLREETLPVHDIRVRFAPGYRISRVHLEPAGRALEATTTQQGTTVVVPRLDVHAMVVAELSKP
jgi:hypothetical protein